MNTKKIKKNFPEVYKKFFTDHEIIISAPFVMNWSGDVMPNYNGVFIKQKIPIRLYLGVKFNNSKEININRVKYLDIGENKFRNVNAFEHAPYFFDITETINKKYKRIIKKYGGIEINILSELSRSSGLGFGPIVLLLISTILKRLDNIDCNQDKLDKINQLDINEVIKNDYIGFKEIFEDSLIFDKSVYGMFFGSTKLSSFFNGYYPTVSFLEDIDEKEKIEIEEVKYYGFRLTELFNDLRGVPYMPIDYGIVYTGNPVILEQVTGKKLLQTELENKVKKVTEKIFSHHMDNVTPNKIPRFYKDFIKKSSESNLSFQYTGKISSEILYFMGLLYSNNYYETYIKNFIYNLRNQRYLDYIHNNSSSYFMAFIDNLTNNFKSTSKKSLGLFPNDSSIMGGCINFALPLEGFRKDILTSVELTNIKFMGSKLIYANWIDGLEYEGLKFEQDFENDLYSDFLGGSNYIVRDLDGKTKLGDMEELLLDNTNDLLLDMVNNKIYLKGIKLTSKDLHSQTTTVEMLKILLKNINKDISNKDLPTSSYSKNKNEMLGKIVLPLITLIEKVTGEKIQFICKGSIYDFYIKLKLPKIKISVLERF